MKHLLQRCLLGLLSLSMCVMTSGCWSAFEIQQVDYAKAFGIDYKDGMYHLYVQTLDFAVSRRVRVQPKVQIHRLYGSDMPKGKP
ncbi:hypothetical protein Q0F98_22980 [Paenibacillus amylolyticus]|nr:hypothetical protein Q0F98_22980 [Paenibacillus amylolyticus]